MHTTKIHNTEVLFQKLGATWYCFTQIDDEMVYSALPQGVNPHTTRLELFEIIEDHMKKVSKHYKKKGPEAAA